MKKFITLIIAAMIVLLCGCGAGATKEPADINTPKEPNDNLPTGFDYYLDRVESYNFYKYLNESYDVPIHEDCTLYFYTLVETTNERGERAIIKIQLSDNNEITLIDVTNSSIHSYRVCPIVSRENLSDEKINTINKSELWGRANNMYRSDVTELSGPLPINIHTRLGNSYGRYILYSESGKIIRIKNDYYLIECENSFTQTVSKNFSFISKGNLHDFMTKNILDELEVDYSKNGPSHFIEWGPQVESYKLKLSKINGEENNGNGNNQKI